MRRHRGAVLAAAALVVAALAGCAASPVTAPDLPAGGSYQQVRPDGSPSFSASFGGSKLDTSVWDTCYPYANQPSAGCTNFGNPIEAEWYLPGQVQVSSGLLRLTAQRQQTDGLASDGSKRSYACRSGMVTSYPGLKLKYGFLQVQAKLPHAAGLWSGLWLAPASFGWPPEMDLIESWGVADKTATSFHPSPASLPAPSKPVPVAATRGWQTYSLYWTKTRMEFFVGSTRVLTITQHVPQQQMYLIADLADTSPVTPGTCSGELDVRSVKYWQLAS